MSDIATSSATVTAAADTAFKLWSLCASIAGSIIPLLALSEKKKISLRHAAMSATVGASFAIFVGPFIAQKFGFTTPEASSALSWILGGTGVYLVRAIITWLEERAVGAIDRAVSKLIDTLPGEDEEERGDTEINVNVNVKSEVTDPPAATKTTQLKKATHRRH